MIARFKGDIECRPSRFPACIGDGIHLGVRTAQNIMPALPDYFAVTHQHSTHHRIRTGSPLSPDRQAKGFFHVELIAVDCGHSIVDLGVESC